MLELTNFDAAAQKQYIIEWIRDWFNKNGKTATAVIGISGGKDSTITAALCVEALGKDRVVGVLMPNGTQSDIDDALTVVNHLGIAYKIVNIYKPMVYLIDAITVTSKTVGMEDFSLTQMLRENLAPRLRMSTLYAVAQGLSNGGRVANTCNKSEDYVGYSTKYGDDAGDFAPLTEYTVAEVLAIGRLCNIPLNLVEKTPSDGLCGQSDEDKLGFTYETLDKYILTGVCEDENTKAKIDRLHAINLHKILNIPACKKL